MSYNLGNLFDKIDPRVSVRPRIGLRTLAEDLAVNRHTVEKAVRECRQMSFRAYQHRKLLEAALRLLLYEGELSEKQIAGRLGYGSTEAFSRSIRRMTGYTPTQIRQDARRRIAHSLLSKLAEDDSDRY